MPKKHDAEVVDDVTFGGQDEEGDPDYGMEDWESSALDDDEDDDAVTESAESWSDEL